MTHHPLLSRRALFRQTGVNLGRIALGSLMLGSAPSLLRGEDKTGGILAAKKPHFAPKAKRVIHLFMAGAPSHLDLFDYKSELVKLEGKPLPPSVIGDQRFAFIRSDAGVMGPRFPFKQYGKSGTNIAEVLPHLGSIVDDVCLIRSLKTDQFNHAPAQLFLNTGFAQPGRPSLGSWVLHGLGAESQSLPAYVVMSTGAGISGGTANWSSGFMPTVMSGCRIRNQGDPILDTSNPAGVDAALQKETIDLVSDMNRSRLDLMGDPEISTRISQYEMAFRLQTSAPELMDLTSESKETLELYGCDPSKPSFARACLLARRMIERGVRFINIYHEGWDAHSDVVGNHKKNCGQTDQGAAALVKDLKRLGLLDDTLVIYGGEFGRTAMVETNPALGRSQGRDHHPHAFSMWMAGGGVKRGFTYGVTDDIGYQVVENPVHIHDLQATILHLLGFDHERLTYRSAGRDYRLTDVHGHVVKGIIA
jgi:uncharacterized protein (DUF1501 family)